MLIINQLTLPLAQSNIPLNLSELGGAEMTAWVVRGGKYGEREEEALENGMLTIGFNVTADLTAAQTREQIQELVSQAHPYATSNENGNRTGQLWAFRGQIETGDLVVMPRKGQPTISIGEISGEYQYRPDRPNFLHGRPVTWIEPEVPRASLDEDLKSSLNTTSTVFRPRSADAEQRLRAMAGGERGQFDQLRASDEDIESFESRQDLAEASNNQVRDFISQKFHGHEFTRLVAAVLKAQGYGVEVAPPGPDGGVDIVAGSGLMGFDPPRICVQVKSGSQEVKVNVLRELAGTVKNFGADYGLLVSWGGFNSATRREARQSNYFNLRLWDSQSFLELLFENYDRLPPSLRAELPLKQVWVLDEPTI